MRDAERENMFVDTFVAPARRDRYRLLIANKKKRRKILDRLNHWFDFIPSLARAIPDGQHSAEGVLNLLRQRGLKDMDMVYIVSDICDLDTIHLPLHEAIENVLEAQFASVVCCVSGKLAYYRPEAPAKGYILETPPRNRSSEPHIAVR